MIRSSEFGEFLRIPNHESRITNHEPRTTNHEPRTTNHEPRTTNHEPRTPNPEPRNLEHHLHRELGLPRIADTRPQEAVEVEQGRRAERVDVVAVVERVEHLDDRDDFDRAAVQTERPRETPVEGEEFVVLP